VCVYVCVQLAVILDTMKEYNWCVFRAQGYQIPLEMHQEMTMIFMQVYTIPISIIIHKRTQSLLV
jgi:hypothetical protein